MRRAMHSILIVKLARPERCGDWHDKPLKWAVVGPGKEVQKFSTKADAVLYRRLRKVKSEEVSVREFSCA